MRGPDVLRAEVVFIDGGAVNIEAAIPVNCKRIKAQSVRGRAGLHGLGAIIPS
jgi:hypothetical protein